LPFTVPSFNIASSDNTVSGNKIRRLALLLALLELTFPVRGEDEDDRFTPSEFPSLEERDDVLSVCITPCSPLLLIKPACFIVEFDRLLVLRGLEGVRGFNVVLTDGRGALALVDASLSSSPRSFGFTIARRRLPAALFFPFKLSVSRLRLSVCFSGGKTFGGVTGAEGGESNECFRGWSRPGVDGVDGKEVMLEGCSISSVTRLETREVAFLLRTFEAAVAALLIR